MHCKKKVVEKLTLKTFSFPLAIIGLIQQVEIIFEERSYYFRLSQGRMWRVGRQLTAQFSAEQKAPLGMGGTTH